MGWFVLLTKMFSWCLLDEVFGAHWGKSISELALACLLQELAGDREVWALLRAASGRMGGCL